MEVIRSFKMSVNPGSTQVVSGWIWLMGCSLPPFFFLIGIVGSGVQLCPLGTAATNWPIVPAPGDYDDGEIGGMIVRGN
jgi:hypothetical protein